MIMTLAYSRRVADTLLKSGQVDTYKTEIGVAVVAVKANQYWRDACMAALPGFVAGRVLDVETEECA